jgi:uncharacterized coiled-coil protein SlyX
MEQYEKSGPAKKPMATQDNKTVRTVEELSRAVDRQDRMIEELHKEIRRLRTDLRSAINAFNIKSNG